MLKLMYITNDPAVAKIAADAGVDRIFIDMEVLGKAERQGGMDTVQSHHTPEDIAKVRAAIGDQAEIMARVNPLNPNSQTEINDAIANGADVIMLPMWRTADDLRQLVRMVNGRAKVMPLLETDTAAEHLPQALAILGIDQMHIGLNDLHLCYHQKFMFQRFSALRYKRPSYFQALRTGSRCHRDPIFCSLPSAAYLRRETCRGK